jgi:hypothetical protein
MTSAIEALPADVLALVLRRVGAKPLTLMLVSKTFLRVCLTKIHRPSYRMVVAMAAQGDALEQYRRWNERLGGHRLRVPYTVLQVRIGERDESFVRYVMQECVLIANGRVAEMGLRHCLEAACFVGHVGIARFLLEQGADPRGNGGLALDWAATRGHVEVVELLLTNEDFASSEGFDVFCAIALMSAKKAKQHAVCALIREKGKVKDLS